MIAALGALAWGVDPAGLAPVSVSGTAEVGASVSFALHTDVPCQLPGRGVVTASQGGQLTVAPDAEGYAWATWSAANGIAVWASDAFLARCDMVPAPYVVEVPRHGAGFGLLADATDALHAERLVVRLGASSVGIWPREAGPATLVLIHDPTVAPTVFSVIPVERPTPETAVRVPVGGAVVLDPNLPPLLIPSDAIEVHAFAGERILVGLVEGTVPALADGVPFVVTVGGGFGAAPTEPVVTVRAHGGTRRFRLDRPIEATLIADPTVAAVSVSGRRIKVHGQVPGTTRIAIQDADGLHWIRVVSR